MAMGTGHGGRQPLEKQRGLETKTAAAGSSAAEAKKPRRVWPAALMACFLAVTAVLLLQRWRTDASPEWLYQVERPAEDDRGASRVHYFPCSYPQGLRPTCQLYMRIRPQLPGGVVQVSRCLIIMSK
uniref:Uncharacterized protein n=1 Tax=Setaria italica TaxID=4555 RepID=K3YWQ7_SETIT